MRLFCLFIVLSCGNSVHADEPFIIRSGFSHRYQFPEVTASEIDAFKTIGLGDNFSLKKIENLKREQVDTQAYMKEQLGGASHVSLLYLDTAGQRHFISCLLGVGPKPSAIYRDTFLEKIGEGAESKVKNGVTIVSGPTTVTYREYGHTVSSWMTQYLRQQGQYLFVAERDDYILSLASKGPLYEPPTWTHSTEWFYICHPSKVPERARKSRLQSAFTAIGVQRQRRDAEALEDYNRRVAVVEVWEQFLRSHYFETEKIVARSSGRKVGKPVRFHFEIDALNNSQFANILRSLRLRRAVPSAPDGIFSGTVNLQLAAPLATVLSLAIRHQAGPFMNDGGPIDSLCQQLKTGEFSGCWCIDQDTDGDLAAALQFTSTADQLATTQSTETTGIGFTNAFTQDSFLQGLHTFKQVAPDELTFHWRQPTSEGVDMQNRDQLTPTVFSMQFNLQQLANSPPGTTTDQLFKLIERAYLLHEVRKFQRHDPDASYDFGNRAIRDGLRAKIREGDPQDWQVKLDVRVNQRDARLTGELVVGPRLLGFLMVAKEYYKVIITEHSGFSEEERQAIMRAAKNSK